MKEVTKVKTIQAEEPRYEVKYWTLNRWETYAVYDTTFPAYRAGREAAAKLAELFQHVEIHFLSEGNLKEIEKISPKPAEPDDNSILKLTFTPEQLWKYIDQGMKEQGFHLEDNYSRVHSVTETMVPWGISRDLTDVFLIKVIKEKPDVP
jgi:hypothetical protein